MRIIAKRTLRAFWVEHPDAEQPLKSWCYYVKKEEWRSLSDVKILFGNASILKNNRVVFNIAGNKYRLIVNINYAYKAIYIRFIGTHEEYDRIDVEEV
tara:strand:- start:98 stop:391 length:294 start_codon:yes stop_codon:yes gene_type:complete